MHGPPTGRPQRSSAQRDSERAPTGARSAGAGADTGAAAAGAAQQRREGEKMGGLALPDVVRELLRDPAILKWHPREEVYEVTHGDNFEKRLDAGSRPAPSSPAPLIRWRVLCLAPLAATALRMRCGRLPGPPSPCVSRFWRSP